MTNQQRTLNVAWAVDPFESSPVATRSAARAILDLCKRGAARVVPIHLRVGFEPRSQRSVQQDGASRLERMLRGIRLTHFARLESLVVPEQSTLTVADAARELLEAARRKHADLVVVTARGGGGPRRLAMGSFAESLALGCDLPLLSIQPGERLIRRADPILFPTDFSAESRAAFGSLLGFARRFGARVVLFHKFRSSGTPVFDFPFALSVEDEPAIEEECLAIRREGERWRRIGREREVEVEVEIDRSDLAEMGRASDAILARASKLRAVIALSSRSGPATAPLPGNTTREVLRSADCPVWVLQPRPYLRLVERDSSLMDDRKIA